MSANPPLCRIEPLECRIAPAAIIVQSGQPGSLPGETDYVDAQPADQHFVNTQTNPADPLSAVVGPGDPLTADTFYLKLDAGSKLKVYASTGGFQTFVSVKTGKVVAFFVDKNLDNEVSRDELTGLSLGPGASVRVNGGVDGDIVGNYSPGSGSFGNGSASSLLANPIDRIFVSGNVNGSVVSGGTIRNVTITGNVDQILAGTAANGFSYDFNTKDDPATVPIEGVVDGGDTLAVSAPAAGVAGVSILKTNIASTDRIATGNAGLGANGGRIVGLALTGDTDGFTLVTGNGGNGTAGLPNGGAGGKISKILVSVPEVGDLTTNDLIQMTTGNGGDSAGAGAGGAGGKVKGVLLGFETINNQIVKSVNTLSDNLLVETGDGGSGRVGGTGGSIVKNRFTLNTPNTPDNPATPLDDESLTVNEIQFLAGNGGPNTAAGVGSRAGLGGVINTLDVRNLDVTSSDASAILRGGDAGAAAPGSSGAKGGSIIDARVLASIVDATGGKGSNGDVRGGAGGSLTRLSLEEHPNGAHTRLATLAGGAGGSGALGAKGGGVKDLVINSADFTTATVTGGNGGNSGNNRGGAGGSLKGIDIVDINAILFTTEGSLSLTGGNGGTSQTSKGGAGGKIVDAFVSGERLNLSTTGGIGGASVSGNGGRGGTVADSSFITSDQVAGIDVVANISAGIGGAGGNAGGAGGRLDTINVIADGALLAAGGTGGTGGAGAVGKGGSLLSIHARSNFGSVTLRGGDAGATGVQAGAGGSIQVARVYSGMSALAVPGDITLRAGDGRAGGAGGSVQKIGYADAEVELDPFFITDPAPSGSVLIQAGNGSSAGVAGAGGAVKNVSGYVGLSGTTQILGGDGGGAGAVSANGGDVRNINIFGGGGLGVEFAIEAGDAGDRTGGGVGAKGGSVRGLSVFAFDESALFRHIGGGNGGDAGGTGGRGGSVTKIAVNHDIGDRSGEGFGYSTMGGIFAGSGGTGGTAGKSGNVVGVSAHAISTIAAGRPEAASVLTQANLANKVSNIVLRGFVDPNDSLAPSSFEATEVDATGAYVNFADANLVGGVVDPQQLGVAYPAPQPHANTFDPGEYGDTSTPGVFGIGDTVTALTDGFIAAVTYINTFNNFKPEALLTLDANGSSSFFDLNNLNGQQIA